MDNPSDNQKDTSQLPAPEALRPRSASDTDAAPNDAAAAAVPVAQSAEHREATPPKNLRHRSSIPSHKATFVGILAVLIILGINAAAIAFVLKGSQSNKKETKLSEVTISQNALEKVGVNRTAIGDTGVQLIVDPNAKFNGKVAIGGDVTMAGQLKLNSKFSANEASLAQLQAGDTSVGKLNINGDSTATNITARKDIIVSGTTRLQGPVNIAQLMTVSNSVNITGNLSVGGTMAINAFQTNTLTSTGILTLGGHIVTRGSAPAVSPGPALGQNGTVSLSGSDMAGTIATNYGVGGGPGLIAAVTFVNHYTNVPRVVVSAVGGASGALYVNRTTNGFNVYTTGSMPPGGYAIDYIVMQ